MRRKSNQKWKSEQSQVRGQRSSSWSRGNVDLPKKKKKKKKTAEQRQIFQQNEAEPKEQQGQDGEENEELTTVWCFVVWSVGPVYLSMLYLAVSVRLIRFVMWLSVYAFQLNVVETNKNKRKGNRFACKWRGVTPKHMPNRSEQVQARTKT